MNPMLDPKRDLAGATPETLARALFRRVTPLQPRARVEPVVRDERPVEQVPADDPSHGVPHLRERS